MKSIIQKYSCRISFAILWMLLICYLCLLPQNHLPRFNFEGIDKLVHFVLFGICMFLICLSTKNFTKNRYITSFVITAVFGLAIEFIQLVFPRLQRSFELSDFIADIVGAIFFGLLHKLISKYYYEKNDK